MFVYFNLLHSNEFFYTLIKVIIHHLNQNDNK